jgi:hypothetical protein
MLRIWIVVCFLTFMFVVNHVLVPIGITRPLCVSTWLDVYVLWELFCFPMKSTTPSYHSGKYVCHSIYHRDC